MDNNFERNIIEQSQLLQATFIFQWIFSIMGINLPPLLYYCPNGCNKKFITYLWFCFGIYTLFLIVLVIWIVYVNNVIVDYVIFSNDLDSITSVLSMGVNIIVAFVQIIAQLVAVFKHNSLKMILTRIAQLERDILSYFREYQLQEDQEFYTNFQRRYQQFSRVIVIRFGLFSIFFSITMCYVNYHLVANIMELQYKILTLILTLALQLKSVEYCIIVQIINELLRSLQISLRHLKLQMAKLERNSIMLKFYHGQLMSNQYLLNRIWFLAKNIEEYFAVPMLVLYLFNGIAITHTINWSYVRSFDYLNDDIDCGMCKYFEKVLN